jgi:hypothetical protein
MKIIQLHEEDCLPLEQVPPAGLFVGDEFVRTVVRETCTVLKPDGSPLLIYVQNVLPRRALQTAFEVFKTIDFESGGNRGLAGGPIEDQVEHELEMGDLVKVSPTRYQTRKNDGTLSNTTRSVISPTAIIGYFDRYPRIPYCRQTAFTQNNPELWVKLLPFIQAVSTAFRDYAPAQYCKQEEFIYRVHPDWVIPRSVFTTITVNRNWRTAAHRDKGDFSSGLGVMAAIEAGSYQGGELVFPKYGVAVDMRTGGVALADVHELHGNRPIEGTPGGYIRFSGVFYCREKMQDCGSNAFELNRARTLGDELERRRALETASEVSKLF